MCPVSVQLQNILKLFRPNSTKLLGPTQCRYYCGGPKGSLMRELVGRRGMGRFQHVNGDNILILFVAFCTHLLNENQKVDLSIIELHCDSSKLKWLTVAIFLKLQDCSVPVMDYQGHGLSQTTINYHRLSFKSLQLMMGYNIFNRVTPGKFSQQPKQFVIGLLITLLTTPTTTFCHTSTGVNNKIRNKSTSQLLNFCVYRPVQWKPNRSLLPVWFPQVCIKLLEVYLH